MRKYLNTSVHKRTHMRTIINVLCEFSLAQCRMDTQINTQRALCIHAFIEPVSYCINQLCRASNADTQSPPPNPHTRASAHWHNSGHGMHVNLSTHAGKEEFYGKSISRASGTRALCECATVCVYSCVCFVCVCAHAQILAFDMRVEYCTHVY